MLRPSGRQPNQLRDVRITRQFTRHAEGSVLVEFGETKVICTASVEASVEGVVIDVIYQGQRLEPSLNVAEACSGMRLLMAFLAFAAVGPAPAEAGSIFVWLPAVSKSITITYKPILEALAAKGHQITVVHPFKMLGHVKGITEIQSITFMDSFLDKLSG